MQIISRDAAAANGLTRFYTGKACQRGHIAERYVSNGACVECLTKTQIRAESKRPIYSDSKYARRCFEIKENYRDAIDAAAQSVDRARDGVAAAKLALAKAQTAADAACREAERIRDRELELAAIETADDEPARQAAIEAGQQQQEAAAIEQREREQLIVVKYLVPYQADYPAMRRCVLDATHRIAPHVADRYIVGPYKERSGDRRFEATFRIPPQLHEELEQVAAALMNAHAGPTRPQADTGPALWDGEII
jgi:hypothetical protein